MALRESGAKALGLGLGTVPALALIVGVVAYVVHSAVGTAIEMNERTCCARNLLQIHAACRAYAAAHGKTWPDLFTEESVSWHDVGNTRSDEWDPAAPAGGPPASAADAALPGDNGRPVQSNTANLWVLVHWGLGPEHFVCPATKAAPDAVDLAAVRTAYVDWAARTAEAQAALAAEKAAAEKKEPDADAGAPRERSLEEMIVGRRLPGPDEKGPEGPPAGREGAAAPGKPLVPWPDIPRDFRGEPFVGYSYQNVLGTFALSEDAERAAELAVAADASPMRRDFWSGPADEEKQKEKKAAALRGAREETAGRLASRVARGTTDRKLAERPRFVEHEDTAGWNAQAECITRPWDLNSPNHGFRGQNVLYLDGHVDWHVHPYCGPNMDNIWLRRRADILREPVADDIANLREYNDPASYDGASSFDRRPEEAPPAAKGDARPKPAAPPKAKDKREDLSRTIADSFLVP